jgi:hypothetical protein
MQRNAMSASLKLAAVVVALAIVYPLRAAEVDVYLLSGQSNMQGSGRIADIPADVPRKIPHAFFWNGKEFEPLVIGKTKVSSKPETFGPEIGFALDTATAERPIYLVKYYASGMPLYFGWNGSQWAGDMPGPGRRNFYPGTSADDPNQGTLYREMLTRYRAALKSLEASGQTPVVRGFVWMQGEMDSKHELSAGTYPEQLGLLRQRLGEDLKAPETLPLVFGQVLPHEPALPRYTHRELLRAKMAAADSRSGQLESLPRTRMVSTDRFGLMPDTVHYDAAGQLRLGRAFAAAMKELAAESR